MERQQSSNTIKNLEAKLREVQQALMTKIRELGLAYSMHTPIDLELGSLTALLEAEEKRLVNEIYRHAEIFTSLGNYPWNLTMHDCLSLCKLQTLKKPKSR
jgi:hypothetical protein